MRRNRTILVIGNGLRGFGSTRPTVKPRRSERLAHPQSVPDDLQDTARRGALGSETQSQIKPDGKTNLDAKTDGKPTPDVKADTKSSEKVGDAKTSITA